MLGPISEAQTIAKTMGFHPGPWSKLLANNAAIATAAADGDRPGLCCGDPIYKPTTHTRIFAAAWTVARLQASLISETMQKSMVSAFRIIFIFDLSPCRSFKIYLRAKLFENWSHIWDRTRYPVNLIPANLPCAPFPIPSFFSPSFDMHMKYPQM